MHVMHYIVVSLQQILRHKSKLACHAGIWQGWPSSLLPKRSTIIMFFKRFRNGFFDRPLVVHLDQFGVAFFIDFRLGFFLGFFRINFFDVFHVNFIFWFLHSICQWWCRMSFFVMFPQGFCISEKQKTFVTFGWHRSTIVKNNFQLRSFWRFWWWLHNEFLLGLWFRRFGFFPSLSDALVVSWRIL